MERIERTPPLFYQWMISTIWGLQPSLEGLDAVRRQSWWMMPSVIVYFGCMDVFPSNLTLRLTYVSPPRYGDLRACYGLDP